ncbi:hypothetical protein QM012_005519 [Aureobasidium pullulans]|uniref:ASX DEUBAD domain-containing protein n=1 Tax=Aureobasidium pullulans TaxID=5580 RepID=A0ABR0T5A3_AURPU
MATTRNDTLKARRVTRSSTAAAKSGSSGITKRKAPTTPKKTTQKSKKAVLKRQKTIEPESAFKERTTTHANRDMETGEVNNEAAVRPVTRSMSKKTSVHTTKGRKAPKKSSTKVITRSNGSTLPAARLTTHGTSNNDESSTSNALPEPPVQARENLFALSRRVTRHMARENTLMPPPSTTNAAVDDTQARNTPADANTTDPPRVRPVRYGVVVHLEATERQDWAAESRAILRGALESDQLWPDLDHAQRREVIKSFEWIRAAPNRGLQDYFNLPLYDEDLIGRPSGDMSIVSRVRAWFENLKMSNSEDEEATDEEEEEEGPEED